MSPLFAAALIAATTAAPAAVVAHVNKNEPGNGYARDVSNFLTGSNNKALEAQRATNSALLAA